MTFKVGPFTLYRPTNGTLNISVTCCDKYSWGWEYGWIDGLGGQRKAWIDIRLGKLLLFYFEPWKRGFEVRLLGFWWIRAY